MKILSSLQNIQKLPPILNGKFSNRFQIEKQNERFDLFYFAQEKGEIIIGMSFDLN